jgi:N-methylhydantoinase A
MFILDIGRDYLRSYLVQTDKADTRIINEFYRQMIGDASKDLEVFAVSPEQFILQKSVEVRYQGQYHMLEIPLPDTGITGQDIKYMEQKFHELHKELFTFSLPWVPIEMINLRLTVKIKSQKMPIKKIAAGTKDPSPALLGKRRSYFGNKFIETLIYDGLKLKAGNAIPGTAIIEEPTTTTVIPAGKICTVDAYGNYIIVTEK